MEAGERERLLSALASCGAEPVLTTDRDLLFRADPDILLSLASAGALGLPPAGLERAVRGPDRARFLGAWRLAPPGGGVALMGVLNVTPDSFSDGGAYRSAEEAVERGEALVREGADVIDVGGESTRPGAAPVPAEEEARRVVPVIRRLAELVPVPISVDTRKAAVAEAALDAGASILNDVSALGHDPSMARLAAERGCGVVLMHMRGTPETMQTDPRYDDPVSEVYDDLARSVEIALRAGVAEEKIVIDPGIGFGKRLADNLLLIRHVGELRSLGFPVLVGPSRKSFLGLVLGLPVNERLEGTIGASVAAALAGADLIRVHDPSPVGRAVRVAEAIRKGGA
jgi:dihydropteroate synthase